MELGNESTDFHEASGEADSTIGRRAFMERAAWLGVMAGSGAGSWARASIPFSGRGEAALVSRLPDGSEFPRWEQPLVFSKTYHVDNSSPHADDDGPGDNDRPFRTIGRAAEILQPGERVVIAAGTYRECVRPARGGTDPTRMISYEAAPGAKVFIKGSEILKDGWRREAIPSDPRRPDSQTVSDIAVWRCDLPGTLFPDAYNPFALPSIMGSWVWLDPAVVDLGPFLRRRGLTFVDGMPLEPVEQLRELLTPLPAMPDFTRAPVSQNGLPPRRRGGPIMQEIGGTPTARVWTDNSGTAIHVRLASGTPADHLIEVTTREHAFIPVHPGTSFIRVKGITFQHAGNAYPFPQYGMISLAGGDHWILEDNVIEWANGMGLDIGSDGDSVGAPHPGASIVVRGNTVRCCGVEGIGGMGTSDTLVEDNLIEWCGWADAERGWEAAGAKFHRARNMLFRRNVVRHIRHASALWFDVDNVNCRVTQNVFADVLTVGAAVHIEMSPAQNSIDNNIIWDVRNAEPGTPGQHGCAGSGIFDNATSNLIIAQNLIGRCDNAGIFAIVRPDRGRPVSHANQVANNIFAQCRSGIVFLSTNNQSDGNVYVDMPDRFQGFLEEDQASAYGLEAWRHINYSDLASWRGAHQWDRNSVAANAHIAFDPTTLRLTIFAPRPLPRVKAVNQIETDMLGQATGSMRAAGPLANLSTKKSWTVDPRILR